MTWPTTAEELAREQERLAALAPERWTPPLRPLRIGACAVVFGRAGAADVGWAAAAVEEDGRVIDAATRAARLQAAFVPGRLALREGPVLEAVVRDLVQRPDVLLVAAAGRDHPRRAGLALHLGALLDLPTVGVTEHPLAASGSEPGPGRMARAPLWLAGEVVAYLVRTRPGARPIVAHAAWRTSAELAVDVVLGSASRARWPEALREVRRRARLARELRPGGRGRGR